MSLETMRRDWIVGVSADAFYAKVCQRVAEMEAIGAGVWQQGVLIVEKEPVAFVTSLMATAVLDAPVILGNPSWGCLEWGELWSQVRPACVFGAAVPAQRDAISGVSTLLQSGSILIPTGGSSGGVKLARHDWSSLAASCRGFFDFMGPGPVNCCCVLPLYHVSGLMPIVRSWLSGGQIIFADFKQIQAGKVPEFEAETLCLSLVPTQLQRVLTCESALAWLKHLRAIFVGGAFSPAAILEKARAEALPIVLSYGMTETAAMVAALPIDAFQQGGTSVGRALSHAKLEIIGSDRLPCTGRQIGRIQVRSQSLFKGYHHQQGSNQCGDVYLTDDEGFWDDSGNLHISGRRDRLIISGGEKIDPQEVEHALMSKRGVSAAMVLAWPDEEWGKKLVAFYTSTKSAANIDWQSALRNDLAPYKIPKEIICVPELPLDEKGKVDLEKLRQLL